MNEEIVEMQQIVWGKKKLPQTPPSVIHACKRTYTTNRIQARSLCLSYVRARFIDRQ